MNPNEVTQIQVVSNQFKVSISETTPVYMYSMVFDPPELDSFLIEQAVNHAERQLNEHFLLFATVGETLIATNEITEEVVVTSRVKKDFEVSIKISPTSATMKPLKDVCEDEGVINQALQQLIAICLRKSFLSQDLV